MTTLHVLRVFLGPGDSGGNPLGVFLDGGAIEASERQRVAADLAFSETVFVDDPAAGALRIFTPASELPLAGHPLVGTAWLLARERASVSTLRPPAGDVATWEEGAHTWIRANPAGAPDFVLEELDSVEAVERLDGAPDGLGMVDAWAWIDRPAGTIRSRVFVADLGIEEDEATGAAALRLTAALGRPLTIRQGKGSEIVTRPAADGGVEIGGRVSLVETRPFP